MYLLHSRMDHRRSNHYDREATVSCTRITAPRIVPCPPSTTTTLRPSSRVQASNKHSANAAFLSNKSKSSKANSKGKGIKRTASQEVLNYIINTGRIPEGAEGGDGDAEMDMLDVTHKKFYGSSPRLHRCLVLDSAYRPVNIVAWSKAVMMDVSDKGEVVEYYEEAYAVSGRGLHPLPAVVRVGTYVDMDAVCSRVACTRRNVFVRDKFQCQYCSIKQNLTVDHVKPVCLGGKNSWTNLVTACLACNQRKGSKMLHSMPGWKLKREPCGKGSKMLHSMPGWKLKREPCEPTTYDLGIVAGLRPSDLSSPPDAWLHFLQPYMDKADKLRIMAREAGVSGKDAPSVVDNE
eukprot:gene21283-28205_t